MKDDENTQSETDTTIKTPENTQTAQRVDWEAQAREDEQLDGRRGAQTRLRTTPHTTDRQVRTKAVSVNSSEN